MGPWVPQEKPHLPVYPPPHPTTHTTPHLPLGRRALCPLGIYLPTWVLPPHQFWTAAAPFNIRYLLRLYPSQRKRGAASAWRTPATAHWWLTAAAAAARYLVNAMLRAAAFPAARRRVAGNGSVHFLTAPHHHACTRTSAPAHFSQGDKDNNEGGRRTDGETERRCACVTRARTHAHLPAAPCREPHLPHRRTLVTPRTFVAHSCTTP